MKPRRPSRRLVTFSPLLVAILTIPGCQQDAEQRPQRAAEIQPIIHGVRVDVRESMTLPEFEELRRRALCLDELEDGQIVPTNDHGSSLEILTLLDGERSANPFETVIIESISKAEPVKSHFPEVEAWCIDHNINLHWRIPSGRELLNISLRVRREIPAN